MELRRVAMTENEAIKELETSIDLAKMCTQNYERKNEIQGYEMAIKALEEIQKYREIGTVEEFREAVEKQTTKKPLHKRNGHYCPICNNYFDSRDWKSKYCGLCGQKLDWSDEDGKID